MNELEEKVEKLQRGIRWSIGFGVLGVVLKLFLPFGWPGFAVMPPRGGAGPEPAMPAVENSNNTITVGSVDPEPRIHAAGEHLLTVREVAARHGVAERTILTWIGAGRIQPPPERDGVRRWLISADYRYQPQSAADSGERDNIHP